MSFGIGLAAILSGFVTSGNFNSFLFGSLMAINPFEKYLIIGLSVVVLAMFLLLYRVFVLRNF